MGLISNRVQRDELKAGDHIYSWRTAYFYAHHGIYMGDNKVIHFTSQMEVTGTVFDKFLTSSMRKRSEVPCPRCTEQLEGDGVVSSCLDCFIAGGGLYLFQYSVNDALFLAARGGTCTRAPSDPVEVVVHRAKYLLSNGFGSYNVSNNNCEDFAIYCKTGLRAAGQKVISGQAASVKAILSAALSASMCLATTTNVFEITATAIKTYCSSRIAADIDKRSDLIKVDVLEIAAKAIKAYCSSRIAADIDKRSDLIKVDVEDVTARLGKGTTVSLDEKKAALNPDNIEVLVGSNFSKWSEQFQYQLGMQDLDLVFRIDEPTDVLTAQQRALKEKWERSNCIALMLMKMTMSQSIRNTTKVDEAANAKILLESLRQRYSVVTKSVVGTLLGKVSSMRYDGKSGIQSHIEKVVDIFNQLHKLEVVVNENYQVECILNSLPSQYDTFKTQYYTTEDKWSLDKLTSLCMQEEKRQKQEGLHSVNVVMHNGNKAQKGKRKGKIPKKGTKSFKTHIEGATSETNGYAIRCFFCKKKGHMKKDCAKHKKWCEERGIDLQEKAKPK